MVNLIIGEIREKLDRLGHLETVLRSGKVLNDVDREHAAELISEYADIIRSTWHLS